MFQMFRMLILIFFSIRMLFAGSAIGDGQLSPAAVANVELSAGRVRAEAVEIYRHITKEPSHEFLEAMRDGGTNVLVNLQRPACSGISTNVDEFSVNVFVARDERRKTIVVKTVKKTASELQCEYIYDETGAVKWVLSFVPKGNGGKLAGKLTAAFEYDTRGKMLRAWRGGQESVLVSRRENGSLYEERGQRDEWSVLGDLSATRSGLTLDEGSIELRMAEELSYVFDYIAMTDNRSLLMRIQDWGPPVEARSMDSKRWQMCTQGKIVSLGHGQKKVFRQQGRLMEVSTGGKKEADHMGVELSTAISGKTNLLFCSCHGKLAVISPDDQTVFFPREYLTRSFKFPFHGLWKSDEERRRWDSERCYRHHLGAVWRTARMQYRKGSDLYRIAKEGEGGKSLNTAIHEQKSVCVSLTNCTQMSDRQLRIDKIQYKGEGECRHIAAIFAADIVGNTDRHAYLFNGVGKLRWVFSVRGSCPGLGGKKMIDQQSIFEFRETGELYRTLVHGAVLVVENGECEFSTDPQTYRLFFDALGLAIKSYGD